MSRIMLWTRCLALGTLIALCGCGSRSGEEAALPADLPGISDAQRAAIADSVERTWAEMMAGARALDPARIRAGYADTPTVAINGVIVEDFDKMFEGTRRWLGSLRRLDATGAAGEWHSAWTAVFRRTGGRWRIFYAHESVPLAAPR